MGELYIKTVRIAINLKVMNNSDIKRKQVIMIEKSESKNYSK